MTQVHSDAFAGLYPDSQPVEPGLVDSLRASDAWLAPLCLVAEIDGLIVGQVTASRGFLLPGGQSAVALGPLGVRVAYQRHGVGSGLMHAVLAAADARDEALVVLLGHPEYYPRFGFRPAAEFGVEPEVPDWAPAFQVRPLTAYRPEMRGTFRYPQPFADLA
ncbi:GNAT family N-acetyltransferase [Actinokineospora iranica]|uniref:Putative acetyltransferase n=1 Tax=Actinokineospora iranica TaxID=1271860 RepID=A0A1G6J5Q8_9PSEU|nr:N-acetyltransferase [Actinokineospora iranica]SDC14051.1 putative acetyltransferase [Actinokineospora iranica]